MWKWLLALFVVCAFVCAGGLVLVATNQGVRDWLKGLLPQPQPTEVRLDAVATGDVVRRVNAPGSIEPRTKVQISAQIIARITALPFREGDVVRTNDVVVRLDSREYAARLEQSQANLKAQEANLVGAQAALKQAKADFERAQMLHESKDIARSDLDVAESAFLRADAQVSATAQAIEVARAQVTQAQKDLDNCTIVAPIDGRIVKLDAEVGELVVIGTLNNPSSVIMEIADLGTMLMKARVDEANVAGVKAGQACTIFINAYASREFTGTVERVGLKRQIDRDGTGYFEVEALVDRPADVMLASGLTASVDIAVETIRAVLKIPSQTIVDRRLDELPRDYAQHALVDKNKAFARVVYVIEAGKAKSVPVRTGSSDLTHTVLIAGLTEGQKVITGPFKVLTTLKDGDAVIDEDVARAQREAAGANGKTPPTPTPTPTAGGGA